MHAIKFGNKCGLSSVPPYKGSTIAARQKDLDRTGVFYQPEMSSMRLMALLFLGVV